MNDKRKKRKLTDKSLNDLPPDTIGVIMRFMKTSHEILNLGRTSKILKGNTESISWATKHIRFTVINHPTKEFFSRAYILNITLMSMSKLNIDKLQYCTQVKKLNLSFLDLTDDEMDNLKRHKNLELLNLRGNDKITHIGIKRGNCKKLNILKLETCNSMTDDGLKCLRGTTSLEELYLSDCPKLSGRTIEYVKENVNLKKLKLILCSDNLIEKAKKYKLKYLPNVKLEWYRACIKKNI